MKCQPGTLRWSYILKQMADRVDAVDGYPARVGGIWTREKLVYLRKYAHAFMVAMAPKRADGKWARLVFVDLLCGPGVDVITGIEERGSPLIALDTTPQFDRLFLSDIEPESVAALEHRIPPHDVARVDIAVGDCHVRAQHVVSTLAWGDLGFAFLDPEGFEVTFEVFRTLAQRRIDILFLFPSGIGIKRNLALFAQRADDTPMDRLWGNRMWRETPIVRLLAGETLSQSEAEGLDQSWVQAFCGRIATLGYIHHDATPPLRNDQRVPMYHLLFFSKDAAGLQIWRNIGRIEPSGQRRMF
jgi:three-Cys-motif partner protein